MLKRLTLSPLWGAYFRQNAYSPVVRAFHAPRGQFGTLQWSTQTSVDTAGWTEVVILGARQALSGPVVSCSQPIAYTSNDDVRSVAAEGNLQLRLLNADLTDSGALGCRSFSEQSRISCPNKYEVTL